jgi:thioredoxin-dependent peroxiredoxin
MRLPAKLLTGLCAMSVLALSAGAGLNAGEKGKGMTIKVGDKAPTFTSVDDTGKTWKSSDHVGKKIVVLYFYPADFTGGCTAQACGFRDNIEALNSKGIEVVGVSGDSAANHKLFKKHEKLNFTLLADEKGELAMKFGVPVTVGKGKATGFDENGGKIDVFRSATIQRYTVVIDKNGNVAALDKVAAAGGDAKRIAELVQKLETK